MSLSLSAPQSLADGSLPSGLFSCRVRREAGGGIALHLCGELDLAGEQQFRIPLRAAVQSARTVTVDLADLDFIDCGGLSALAEAAAQLNQQGGRLFVRAAHGQVERVLGLSDIPDAAVAPREVPDAA